MGAGAAALGLGGEVDADAFGALIAGTDPSSGAVLRAGSGRDRVCALDLTFSAPKSVSVLFAIGDGETSRALVEAHEEAVGAAVGYLEREACRVRRGRGGRVELAAEGFVAAALPPSHEPGGPAAAAYPRGGGQSCSRLGRAVVGAAWVSDFPACQGGWFAVSGPSAGRGTRTPAVGVLGRGPRRDGGARGRAAWRARAFLAPAGGDPGVAGGRGSLGAAVGGEGRAGHARAEGRAGGAGAVVRAGAGGCGRARPRARRAHGVDSRSKPVPVATGRPRPRGRVPGRAGGADRPAQQRRGAARGGRAGRRSFPRCIGRGGPAGGGPLPGAQRRRGHCARIGRAALHDGESVGVRATARGRRDARPALRYGSRACTARRRCPRVVALTAERRTGSCGAGDRVERKCCGCRRGVGGHGQDHGGGGAGRGL